jgi:hypothetical protein
VVLGLLGAPRSKNQVWAHSVGAPEHFGDRPSRVDECLERRIGDRHYLILTQLL